MVNNSINISTMDNHLSPEIVEHKKDHNICWWKSFLKKFTEIKHNGFIYGMYTSLKHREILRELAINL
jgi:hypothetical protein